MYAKSAVGRYSQLEQESRTLSLTLFTAHELGNLPTGPFSQQLTKFNACAVSDSSSYLSY